MLLYTVSEGHNFLHMYVVETEENDLQSRDLELSLDSRNPTRRRGRELGPGNFYHGDDVAGGRRRERSGRERERERSVPNGIQIKGFIGRWIGRKTIYMSRYKETSKSIFPIGLSA